MDRSLMSGQKVGKQMLKTHFSDVLFSGKEHLGEFLEVAKQLSIHKFTSIVNTVE